MALSFKEALQRLENRRVKATRPLIPPQILQEDLPLCVLLLFYDDILTHMQDFSCCEHRR
jgi:hypothetical protein